MKQFFFWLILLSLIVFRYFSTRPVYQNGDSVRITSVVFSDPISYPGYQSIKLLGLKISLPVFPEIYYGDKIVVEGIIDGQKLIKTKLISVSQNKSFGSGVRNKIIAFYQRVLPQPMSGLTAGITLGSKGIILSDFWNKVKNTGIAHVVVASGTNVTFVISFLMGVLTFFFKRKKAIILCLLGIILYLFLSGFDAPLVRAAIMAFVAFWSESSGRLIGSWRNLLLTAGIMLVIQPDWLTDIGFALSFTSSASIMLFEKRIKNKFKFLPVIIKDGFSTSLAAQIGVAPILFVTFGQFNLLSPIINALVLWTIPYIMILGSLGGIIGLVFPLLGKLVLWLGYPLMWWFTEIVNIFG